MDTGKENNSSDNSVIFKNWEHRGVLNLSPDWVIVKNDAKNFDQVNVLYVLLEKWKLIS